MPTRLKHFASQWSVPLLIVAAAGGYWLYRSLANDHRDEMPPETHDTVAETSDGMPVTVEPVTRRSVQRSVSAVGSLWGFEDVVLSAKVEGRVKAIHHEVSDRVTPDTLLVEIDPTDFDLAVRQAEDALQVELAKYGLTKPPDADFQLDKVPSVVLAQAKLDNSMSRMERLQVLAKKDAASKEELENIVSNVRMMQAEFANQLLLARSGLALIRMRETALETAKQQLEDTQLRVPTPTKPLPGYEEGTTFLVTKRNVSEGSFVRVGGEIVRLTIDRVLKLRVPVPERFIAQAKLGQKVEVRTAAYDHPFDGAVTLISPVVDPATRTFDVEIQVANPNGELKPGSFAKATVETRRQDNAPTVPLSAVVNFAGVTKIFLLEGDRAREVQITLGVQTKDWVEVATPPLPADAVIITSGHANLATDMQVAVRGEVARTEADPLRVTSRPHANEETPAAKEAQGSR